MIRVAIYAVTVFNVRCDIEGTPSVVKLLAQRTFPFLCFGLFLP